LPIFLDKKVKYLHVLTLMERIIRFERAISGLLEIKELGEKSQGSSLRKTVFHGQNSEPDTVIEVIDKSDLNILAGELVI